MADSTTLARQADGQALAPQGRLTVDMVSEMTGYEPMQIALVSRTVAKDAPLQELAVFLHACRTLNLDPLLRQAYWIRRKSREQVDGEWKDVYRGALQVGIDGFRALADRQGNYAGSEAPVFYDWQELTFTEKVSGEQVSRTIAVPGRCQVRTWKIVQGRSCAFTGEVNWSEFYPGPGANGAMWRKMPKHQMAKCAEAQSLRKGWPALLGAMQLTDEPDAADPEAGPIGMPVITEGPIGQQAPPRAPQRPRPSTTAADYDRMFPDDERVDVAAEAAPPAQHDDGPETAMADTRSRRDKAEDSATAKRQDAVL